MSVFKIYTHDINPKNERRLFVLFDCPTAESVQDLTNLLNEGLVAGHQLFTKPAHNEGPGVMEVQDSRDYSFSKGAVYTIEVPNMRFVSYSD